MNVTLTNDERLEISAVVHQNYYMPEVFATVEKILTERLRPFVRDEIVASAPHKDEEYHRWHTSNNPDWTPQSCGICQNGEEE